MRNQTWTLISPANLGFWMCCFVAPADTTGLSTLNGFGHWQTDQNGQKREKSNWAAIVWALHQLSEWNFWTINIFLSETTSASVPPPVAGDCQQKLLGSSCCRVTVCSTVPLFHCSEFHVVDHVVIFLGCGLHMDFFKGWLQSYWPQSYWPQRSTCSKVWVRCWFPGLMTTYLFIYIINQMFYQRSFHMFFLKSALSHWLGVVFCSNIFWCVINLWQGPNKFGTSDFWIFGFVFLSQKSVEHPRLSSQKPTVGHSIFFFLAGV